MITRWSSLSCSIILDGGDFSQRIQKSKTRWSDRSPRRIGMHASIGDRWDREASPILMTSQISSGGLQIWTCQRNEELDFLRNRFACVSTRAPSVRPNFSSRICEPREIKCEYPDLKDQKDFPKVRFPHFDQSWPTAQDLPCSIIISLNWIHTAILPWGLIFRNSSDLHFSASRSAQTVWPSNYGHILIFFHFVSIPSFTASISCPLVIIVSCFQDNEWADPNKSNANVFPISEPIKWCGLAFSEIRGDLS
jgi:hypothetical protein